MAELILIKWGGSLITDKSRHESARPEVLARLAAELAELVEAHPGKIVLGHGSGSFGHRPASQYGVANGVEADEQLPGLAATQDRAAVLHRFVVDALRGAGILTYSIHPGSAIVGAGGRPARVEIEPLLLALDRGFLPIVFGDVVLDRERGGTIFSTEKVFMALAPVLAERGRPVERVFWLGETDGIYNDSGETIAHVAPEDLKELDAQVGGSSASATDVTGGMRHRLEGAMRLLEGGAESWVVDGRERRVVARVLAGEELGTRIARR